MQALELKCPECSQACVVGSAVECTKCTYVGPEYWDSERAIANHIKVPHDSIFEQDGTWWYDPDWNKT